MALVVLFDTWAITMEKQTMSGAYRNGMARKTTVVPCLFFWFGLTWHLIRPEKMRRTDLLTVAWDYITERKKYE